jgi:glycine/D-amino acid oxidase-like deaminating enzyme
MVRRVADVVVVGAGVIGASIAFELAKLGLRVVVVDKAGGAGHGSTSASSAIVRFNYSNRDGVATAWESKHCWDNWADHLQCADTYGMASFRQTGMIMLDVPVAPRARAAALLGEVGVPYEELDAEALRARVPGIDPGRYWPPKRIDEDGFFDDAVEELGGLYMPDAGFVDDPQLAAHNLMAAAESRGAVFLFHREVIEVLRDRGRVAGVNLSDGEGIDARIVVNAAGPWSGHFNRLAGIGGDFNISVRPMRQEVHHVEAPPAYSPAAGLGPIIADLDLGIYIRPANGSALLIGGTEPACDPLEWLDNPDDANPNATAPRFAAQVTRAARRLSTLRIPSSAKGIAGVYDVADDWTPIYDRTELDGFYVAIGTSGNQFKNAPLVGRFLALLIDRVEAGHDHDRDPLQYRCDHTLNVINLGRFSRRRSDNEETTGTVMG